MAHFNEGPMAPVPNITDLAWNAVDNIVAFVLDTRSLCRLAHLHSCFNTALDYEPLWEKQVQVHLPAVHASLQFAPVDSWRSVLRRHSQQRKMQAMSQLIGNDGGMTGASRSALLATSDLDFSGAWALGPQIQKVVTVLSPRCQLVTLNLDGQCLTNAELTAVRGIISFAPQLRTLSMNRNQFTAGCGSQLADIILAGAAHLEVLGLSRCGVTGKETTALAMALAQSCIHTLILDESDLGSTAATEIVSALAGRTKQPGMPPPRLQRLTMVSCGLEATPALSRALGQLVEAETTRRVALPEYARSRLVQSLIDLRCNAAIAKFDEQRSKNASKRRTGQSRWPNKLAPAALAEGITAVARGARQQPCEGMPGPAAAFIGTADAGVVCFVTGKKDDGCVVA